MTYSLHKKYLTDPAALSTEELCQRLNYLIGQRKHRHSTLYSIHVIIYLEELSSRDAAQLHYQHLHREWRRNNSKLLANFCSSFGKLLYRRQAQTVSSQ